MKLTKAEVKLVRAALSYASADRSAFLDAYGCDDEGEITDWDAETRRMLRQTQKFIRDARKLRAKLASPDG